MRHKEGQEVSEILFVTINLERTARGLAPAVVLSQSLDAVAQAGAQADRDPAISRVPRALPGGGRIGYLGGTWAGGWSDPLGSDYGWIYDDGPGSPNGDCRTASSAACWGHRDIILASFNSRSCGGGPAGLAAGAGHAVLASTYGASTYGASTYGASTYGASTYGASTYGESDTEILAGVCGPIPTDAVFTWAQARKLLHIT